MSWTQLRIGDFVVTTLLVLLLPQACGDKGTAPVPPEPPPPPPVQDYTVFFRDATGSPWYRLTTASFQLDSVMVPVSSYYQTVVSADGSRIAIQGRVAVTLYDSTGVTVLGSIPDVGFTSLSPDGQWVGIGNAVYRMTDLSLAQDSLRFNEQTTFSPDSRYYCGYGRNDLPSGNSGTIIGRVDLLNNFVLDTHLITPSEMVTPPIFSQDGRFVFVYLWASQLANTLEVYDTDSFDLIYRKLIWNGWGRMALNPTTGDIYYSNPNYLPLGTRPYSLGWMHAGLIPQGIFSFDSAEYRGCGDTTLVIVNQFVFTPDGRRIVALNDRAPGKLLVIDAVTHEVLYCRAFGATQKLRDLACRTLP